MRHVIIDTDIGTDVDDLLALVFIANYRYRIGCHVAGLAHRKRGRAASPPSKWFGTAARRANQTMVEVFGTEPEQPARSISGISDGTA